MIDDNLQYKITIKHITHKLFTFDPRNTIQAWPVMLPSVLIIINY